MARGSGPEHPSAHSPEGSSPSGRSPSGRSPSGRIDAAVGGPDRGASDGAGDSRHDLLEVRVIALGGSDGTRFLAMGRLADGSTVTFATDRRAAEAISDAMAARTEPIATIERWQVIPKP